MAPLPFQGRARGGDCRVDIGGASFSYAGDNFLGRRIDRLEIPPRAGWTPSSAHQQVLAYNRIIQCQFHDCLTYVVDVIYGGPAGPFNARVDYRPLCEEYALADLYTYELAAGFVSGSYMHSNAYVRGAWLPRDGTCFGSKSSPCGVSGARRMRNRCC